MGYNQHQSFFLRERWLGKGLREIKKDPAFFFNKDAFEKIGLGKNMVQSLRHWLGAMQTVEDIGTGKNRKHNFLDFGNWVLENDPAIKRFETAALLHYFVVSEEDTSTTWYWFYNLYNESITNREDLLDGLIPWIQERETRVISENSIKRDVDCLIRMYTAKSDPSDPEEVTSSPFTKLGLLEEIDGVIYKREPKIPKDSTLFIKYILLKYCDDQKSYEISLEDVINKEGLLGKTYNLSRSTLIDLLMDLIDEPEFPLQFTRTNNLDMLLVPAIDPVKFLENSSL